LEARLRRTALTFSRRRLGARRNRALCGRAKVGRVEKLQLDPKNSSRIEITLV